MTLTLDTTLTTWNVLNWDGTNTGHTVNANTEFGALQQAAWELGCLPSEHVVIPNS